VRLICLAALANAAFAMPLLAQTATDVPSCYTDPRIALVPAAPKRELFVVIDETTPLDAAMRDAVTATIHRLVTPGNAFTIVGFSAFGSGRAVKVEASGVIETGVPPQQRGNISVPALRGLDTCLAAQARFAQGKAQTAVATVMARQSNALAHSDIMASLREIAPRIATSAAPHRVVLLVSDMIENSSTTSFYKSKTLRLIKPEAELATASSHQLIGNFGNARVFVLGAGTLPDAAAYRDVAAMDALQAFWQGYFDRAHAILVEFGRPNLLRPVN
jgi:methionine-rich copper-binding protein CopC